MLQVDDREPELLVEGAPDGLTPTAADVEMGGLALPIGDREDLVGGERPEGVERDPHREGDAEQDVGRVVGGQVQLRGDEQPDHHAAHHLRDRARTSGDDDGVDDADDDERQHDDWWRREGVARPPSDARDVEGPRSGEVGVEDLPDDGDDDDAPEVGEQVAPPPEHHQRDDQTQAAGRHGPAGAEAVDAVHDIGQPVGAEAGDRPEDGRIRPGGEPVDRLGDVCEDRPKGQHAHRGQPELAGEADAAGEGRRCAGRTAAAAGATRRRRSRGCGGVEPRAVRRRGRVHASFGGHENPSAANQADATSATS